ncbi:MAG: hypothetical protein ACJAQ4_001611 [Cryomorphaceae bacterium]|jgi:hypothetical protein
MNTPKCFHLKDSAFLIFISMLLSSGNIYAQQGPGGVSVETGTLTGCGSTAESTCGVWLDASTLSLADGSDVNVWTDVSFSADCDNGTVPNNILPPIFRNDPAFTINGLPTLTFEDNRYFIMASSDDLNTERVTNDKMVFLAFRTSEDINEKQMIYEEGGTVRGFNIMIDDGLLIIGAYDKNVDNDGGVSGNADNTPAWGYSYVSNPIQPNTTYILCAQFKATTPGVLGNNANNYLRGWLNGTSFGGPGTLIGGNNFNGFNNQGLLGTLYDHPNPCGLGAVNDDTVDREQVINGNANTVGTWSFKGKLAEMCYYKNVVTETQRLIVQNYLASKYLAVLNTQDWYSYEFAHGKDVIGIGQRINNSDLHDLSQGRNPFRISTNGAVSSSPNQYYFTGHNGLNMTWTNVGVPNNSTNIRRLNRVWRVDRTSFVYEVIHEIDEDLLPARPSGYTTANSKLVLLIDETSANIPDFTLATTTVSEIEEIGTAPFDYQIDNVDIPDGGFFTLAWLKPEVNFVLETDLGLESNPDPDFSIVNVELKLNYTPIPGAGAYDVDFTLIPGTAALGLGPAGGDDFYYNSATPALTSATASFFGGNATTFIQLRIINDVAPEDPSTEDFVIQLTGTTSPIGEPALLIGPNFELDYTIFDDDPPPKISFPSWATNIQVNETAGTVDVSVVRDGTATGVVTCNITIRGAGTTARWNTSGLDPQDYDHTFTSNLSFPAGPPSTQTLTIPILDDNVDEALETIEIRIASVEGGAGAISANSLRQTIEIIDDDIPVASFAAPSQSGFESNGAPSLLITLDPISSRDVVVNFDMTPGSATYSQDYAGAESGTVLFPPFTDEAFIGPFFVYPDGLTENLETVEFDLTGTTPNGETTIVQLDQLVYNILDYQPFEWLGAAGIGKISDNVVWIDATSETTGNKISLANRAPFSIAINDQNTPATNIASSINGQNALHFNGNSIPGLADFYEIENDQRINTSGTVDKLAYFFVFSPDVLPTVTTAADDPTTENARLLYEQGGGTRGVSIYLHRKRLYFHAWNNNDDDGGDNIATTDTIEGNQAPWGNNGDKTNSVHAFSQELTEGQNYVVSCIYNNFSSEPLTIYVNGEKGTPSSTSAGYNQFGIGRLWGHAGRIGLGAVNDNTRFHFANGTSSDGRCAFDGKISEFISFHEPELTQARRVILENYLSGKYDIALTGSGTPQIWDLSDPEQNLFNHQIAGLGQAADGSAHTDASGPSAIFRINNPTFNSTSSYILWGHNNGALTNTWPYSNTSNPFSVLPDPIQERSGQVWKIYESGDVATATIQINFSASDSASEISQDFNLLKLLTHSNADPQDFSSANIYSLSSPSEGLPGGNVARFQNIPITNGMYVTLGNTSGYFGSPLPIELISFDAELNGTYVDLTWQTATEINNDYFVVERASEDLDWKPILSVTGAGNSNSLLTYSDKDRAPLDGLSYYRLKQIDFDGQFAYSEIVTVFNNRIQSTDDVFMFPNPSSNGSVFIRIPEGLNKIQTELRLFDISGKLLQKELYNTNTDIHELSYGNLIPGIYFIQISSQLLNETKKLIVK